MLFSMQILSEADIARIEQQAFKVMAEVGIMVYNEELCEKLQQSGLPVADGVVRCPPETIRWALQVAPRDVSLHGRNCDVLPLKHGYCHLSTYADGVNVTDYEATHLRPSTKQDAINFIKLGQAMPEIGIVNGVCYARDLPDPIQVLHTVESVMLHTNKHNNAGPLNIDEAHIWVEMAEIAGPGINITEKPTISFVVSPTSPLQLDEESSKVLDYAVSKKIPFIACSCPMSGGTSPMALVGTIVQHLAEDLLLLTMAQFLNPGTPVVIGGAAGILDIRTGLLSYGAAERHLLLGAIIELADHYDLPHHSPAGSVDSWYPDVHAGAEKMQCWMARKLKDIVWGVGFGSLASGVTVSMEQFLIDIDLWHQMERFFRGLDMTELDNSFEVISRVGQGGNFLTDAQTFRLMRSEELYMSDLVNRDTDRGPAMLERTHNKVQQILAEHQYSPPDSVVAEIQRYVQEKEQELMEKALY